MKTVTMYLLPNTTPTPAEMMISTITAFLVGLVTAGFTWMGGQHPVIQMLIVLQVGDYLAKIYAMTRPDGERGFWSQFTAAESVLGFVRKAIIGILALGVWYIATLAKPFVGQAAEVMALTLIGIAAFTEGMSILKHLRQGKYEAVDDMQDVILKAANEYKAKHGITPPIVVEIKKET